MRPFLLYRGILRLQGIFAAAALIARKNVRQAVLHEGVRCGARRYKIQKFGLNRGVTVDTGAVLL